MAQTIDKARGLIETGSHYEAQQMLKTVYHRQRARKQVADSYAILKVGLGMQQLAAFAAQQMHLERCMVWVQVQVPGPTRRCCCLCRRARCCSCSIRR